LLAYKVFSVESTFVIISVPTSWVEEVFLKFGYSSKTRSYFIARCALIAQVAGPMLSCVT